MRLLLLVLAASLPASAQVRRLSLVVIGNPPDAITAERALTSHLQSDSRFEYVSLATAARDDGPAREAKGIDARRLFTDARDKLDGLDFAKAIATLDKAIKLYEESDLSTGASGLIDAIALRALAAFAKNDKASFNNDAQRVLAMSPNYAWDPNRLTPPAEAALAPLRRKAAAGAPASLKIESTPAGAWAYLDGAFRGVTPLQLGDVPAGSHVVTLVATGYELVQERVFAGPGSAASHPLKSSPRGKDVLAAVGEVRAAAERGDVAASGGALGRLVLSEEVLVTVMRDHGFAMWRVLADGTLVGETQRKAIDELQAAAKELLGAKLPERTKPVEAPAVAVAAPPDHSGRRPVAWICSAAALASVGVGIGLGLSSKARAAEANRLPQIDTAGYDRIAGQARAQAAAADALFGVAVIAAGVGIFMFVTGYAGSSSDGGEEDAEAVSLAWGPTFVGARW